MCLLLFLPTADIHPASLSFALSTPHSTLALHLHTAFIADLHTPLFILHTLVLINDSCFKYNLCVNSLLVTFPEPVFVCHMPDTSCGVTWIYYYTFSFEVLFIQSLNCISCPDVGVLWIAPYIPPIFGEALDWTYRLTDNIIFIAFIN